MIRLDPSIAETLERWLELLQDLVRDDLGPEFIASRMDPESGAVVVAAWPGDECTTAYQAAVVRAATALEQHGLFADDARRLATRASDFLLRNLWDDDHGGWFDSTSQAGGEKTTTTQAAAMAALAEFLMVSGDFEVAERVVETFKTIQVFAANNRSGGYEPRFTREWGLVADAPSPDMFAILAEAFGLAHRALGSEIYHRRTVEAVQWGLAMGDSPAVYSAGFLGVLDADQFEALFPEADAQAAFVHGAMAHAAEAAPVHLPVSMCTLLDLHRLTRDEGCLAAAGARLDRLPPEQVYAELRNTTQWGLRDFIPVAVRLEERLIKTIYGAKKS